MKKKDKYIYIEQILKKKKHRNHQNLETPCWELISPQQVPMLMH